MSSHSLLTTILADTASLPVVAAVCAAVVLLSIALLAWTRTSTAPNLFAPDPKYWKKGKGGEDDGIIKIGYKKHIRKEYDVVVIGSGLGGLSAAALMAKAGRKVCVLEQHDRAGGCSHVFKEHGWEWDVGLHYVGRLGNPSTKNRIISDMMTDGNLEWNKLDDNYGRFSARSRARASDSSHLPFSLTTDITIIREKQIKFYGNLNRTKESLYQSFPNEKKAIDKYFDMCMRALTESEDAFDHIVKPSLPWYLYLALKVKRLFERSRASYWLGRTTQSVLDECTSNKELQAALTYNWGDFGTPPSKSSFWIMAGLQYHFWSDGAYYPVGGPVNLAKYCIPIIQRAGGHVFVRAPVEKILLKNGSAVGVKIANGGPAVMAKDAVVSNAGLNVTWNKLLPKVVAKAYGYDTYCKKIGPSFAGVSLFVGFDRTTDELKLPSTNMWIFPGDKDSKIDIDCSKSIVEDGPPLLFLGFPSAKDPEYTKRNPGKGVASIISSGTFEEFAKWEKTGKGVVKKRGEEYEAVKKRIAESLLEVMYKQFPQTRGRVAYYELGTPLTNKHYLGYESGEIYGLDHTIDRFKTMGAKISPKTPIKGLFLTGQDLLTCGITSAMTSGVFAAGAVLKRNLYFELQAESKRRKREYRKKHPKNGKSA